MLPITPIFTSSMHCNAVCFPALRLSRSNGFAVCRQPLLPRASSNGDRVGVLDFVAVFMEPCVDFAELFF